MTDGSLDDRFAASMGALLGPDFPNDVALAVSGGGDSMAMLALAHNWARVWGVRLWVVTVDHGLRAESADEAAMVARECATLGHAHATLRWHWDGKGNVQDAARRARLSLIDRWRAGLEHVLMAHTQDDVAENFLIRLARGSGVEGLSAMQAKRYVVPRPDAGHPPVPDKDVTQSNSPPLPTRRVAGVPAFSKGFHVIRPCLEMSREELRHHAKVLHMPWAEDPSNEDPKYDRVRARKLMRELGDLGIEQTGLAKTADRMARAAEALRARAVSVAKEICEHSDQGCVSLDRVQFAAVERDTQLRLLAAACMWASGAEYRPRADSLEDLLDRLLGGGAGTLIGAKAQTDETQIWVFREYAAVAEYVVDYERQETPWDGRWRLISVRRDKGPLTIRALGEAVKDCPAWRETGLPRAALMASPALWRGDALIAAPVARYNPNWRAQIVTPFITYLLSH